MAFDGAGTFLRLRSWIVDATNSVKIRADYHDDEDNNFANGLSHCITKDGQTAITQNIPFNSRRIISLADPIDPQDAATKDYADTKMPLDGSVPMTGDIVIKNDDPTITLNGKPGFGDAIYGQKNDKNRWVMILGNATAETGNDAGSDFELANYHDDGSVIGDVLAGTRSTGLLTVKGDPTTALGVSTKQYADLTAINAASSKLPLTGGTVTGALTVNGTTNIQSVLYANNTARIFSNLYVDKTPHAGGSHIELTGYGDGLGGYYVGVIQCNPNAFTCNLYAVNYTTSAQIGWRFDIGSVVFQFLNDGKGRQNGGGVWLDQSDARIKNVVGDYTSGLDAVAALQPVRFTFKGNDTMSAVESGTVPYTNSTHYDAAVQRREFIGLIAQDAEGSMPEMVKQEAGYIDGKQVTDIRTLDTGPLVFALINAVKELQARVVALEGA